MNPSSNAKAGRVWVVGCLTLATALGQSQTSTLTVDQAVKDGLEMNPQSVAGKAGVLSALANYRSLAVPLPITLGATHVLGTSTAPTLNGTNTDTFLDFGDSFDLSGQRRYSAAAANATYKSTLYQYQESLLTLEQQIRDGYWSLAAAQAQTQIADVSLKEAQRVYDLTVKQEQAGSSPKSDVIRSSIDVANAKQTLIAAHGAEKTALFALNNLIAKPPTTPEVLADDLSNPATVAPELALPNVADLNKLAKLYRPLLKSVGEQSKSARYSEQQAEAARFPDFAVDYQRSLTQPSIDSVVFGVNFPLLDFGSVRQSIRASREARRQVEAQQEQTRQQVEQQVAQAQADLDVALQAAASYKKEILDPSEQLLKMAQLGYSQGATGILPVIDAESTIRQARVGYLNALVAVYKAQDEILAATGKPLDGAKR